MPRLSAAKRSELRQKFTAFDKSGKGKLNFPDMKDLLLRGNPSLGDSQLKVLFSHVDKNGDGWIDFDEFVAYLYDSQKAVVVTPPEIVQVFETFCAKSEMDGTEFAKFCVDCHLVDKSFKKEDVATTFAKVVPRGQRKITSVPGVDGFSQLDKVLCLVAEKKNVAPGEVHRAVSFGKKQIVGTEACSSTVTRSASSSEPKNFRVDEDDDIPMMVRSKSEATSMSLKARAQERRRTADRYDVGGDGDWVFLVEERFKEFDKDGKGLDNSLFIKICDMSGLLDSSFTKGEADILFSTLKMKRLNIKQFKEVLREVACKKQIALSDVQLSIAKCTGPFSNAMIAHEVDVPLHDNRFASRVRTSAK